MSDRWISMIAGSQATGKVTSSWALSTRKTAIGTLVERKTRLTLLVKLPKKDAPSVCEAFAKTFNQLPAHLRKSLTYDQGQEMADHKIFTEQTKIKVYF
ncbi:MAG TPA: IS30 family transposase, partial [Flavobacterium sp.]|nr:IS30 family transposase [Flavobacterium sp.]